MSKAIKLSKSRINEGLTCEKKVYLSIHQPDLKPPPTPQQQARFDAGNEVGDLARTYFPGGVLIDHEPWQIDEKIRDTAAAITQGNNTIYEATFGNADYHCRIDILHRENAQQAWNVFEVKSGLDPKPEYILDLAIQCWILNACNVKWSRAYIVHLNRECVFPDLSNLFVRADVTDRVNDILADFGGSIDSIKKVLMAANPPDTSIGRHCEDPYECAYKAHCWKHVPNPSVFDLPNGWKLFDKGKLKLEDVSPKDLTPTQKLPFDVIKKNYVHIDTAGIKEQISRWEFPLYHLDFETIGPAIPRYPGTSPYNQIPFQFSLHIQHDLQSAPEHHEFLHDSTTDPRRPLAEKLVSLIPEGKGSVVAYNSRFEAGVLRDLAEMFPDLANQLLSIAKRLVDPTPVIKGNVYHKDFKGSFSLKEVAPALLGPEWDYSRLQVGDGKMAQIAFDEMLSTADEGVRTLRREQLLAYCRQDTLAMVELVKWLSTHKHSISSKFRRG